MERVSLFIDLYNFLNTSRDYLNQQCFIDFIKMQEYFINETTQILSKTYIYGGSKDSEMLKHIERQPRIDVIRGEVGSDHKEKCTDINLATGLLIKAFYNTYDVALIFSGDRDYKKVVRELRRMGKIIGIVTPGGKAKKNAKDLIRNADFSIILDEEFYKKYWNNPSDKPYESMMNKPRTKKEDKIPKEKSEIKETKSTEKTK